MLTAVLLSQCVPQTYRSLTAEDWSLWRMSSAAGELSSIRDILSTLSSCADGGEMWSAGSDGAADVCPLHVARQ